MEWRDEGLVIGVRRHGETSAIVELMTREHGRHAGVVRGARSRALRPILQIGNTVAATWRARIDEQIGTYAVEGTRLRTADLLVSEVALEATVALTAMLRLLPDRDPHQSLFEGAVLILDHALAPGADLLTIAALIVRFEVELLSELGFGLDLSSCAATGSTTDLVYVSPKSGRAVSSSAGARYHDRLLGLPWFLVGASDVRAPSREDVAAGFAVTGHFLARNVFGARGLAFPDARRALIARLSASADPVLAGREADAGPKGYIAGT